MKRFLLLLTTALTILSLFAATAEAKRFGGGASIGKQRTMSAPPQGQQAPAAAPATPAQPPAAQPQPAGNKWLGPLAGLAAGAGLALPLAGSGLGGSMGTILMVMLAAGAGVMLLGPMLRRPQQRTATPYVGAGAPYPSNT